MVELCPSSNEKRRTITLTNRAPIQIVETDWPVIAQGICDDDEWSIELRVRRHKDGRVIVHANYYYEDPANEKNDQRVRVGRYLDDPTNQNLWDSIAAVGEELRVRILNEHAQKFVVHTIDACFAHIPASKVE